MRSSRFEKGLTDAMRRLNASIGFDRRLYNEDIDGSLAWAEALAKRGLISREEEATIRTGLETIREEIRQGRFPVREELEDVHMHIEARLTELIGEAGQRLHTGRSRNDQVATDFRLHVREAARDVARGLSRLVASLVRVADREIEVVIPAYTHLQRAQPVLFSHHLLAYAEMFLRDRDRFAWAASQADVSPLGSGACAGNQFGMDREFLRERLGFNRLTHNSLDAVSDRDFACDFLHAATLFLVHISRLSEDVILWSSAEFGLVTLDDSVTTGSSLLPQKKNPDACELGRGKCGRVLGSYTALVTVLKGLALAYNKDLQEDKEGVFDAIDTVDLLLEVFPTVIETLQVRRDRAQALLEGGFLDAMNLADYLTRKGVPFREAHETAGGAVRKAEAAGKTLAELPFGAYRDLHEAFDTDLFECLGAHSAVEDKVVIGGTAPQRVREEIARLRDLLAEQQ